MDWNTFFNNILTESVKVLLPILITLTVGYLASLIRTEIARLEVIQPSLTDKIQTAANWARGAVEQLRKKGLFPTDDEAIEEGIRLAKVFLVAQGVKTNLDPYLEIIKNSIEKAIDDNRTVITTNSIATVESSVSTALTPLVNNTVNEIVGSVVNSVEKSVPSVVTTTTSSTVSNNPDDVVVVAKVDDGSVG